MNIYIFEEAYNKAVQAISDLKKEAESLRDKLDEIIEACETLENNI